MGRSRSRSPARRERRRSRSRSRERRRGGQEKRRRSRSPHERRRSRSRERHRSPSDRDRRPRSRSYEREQESSNKDSTSRLTERKEIDPDDLKGKSEEEIEMMKLMGFGSFETTKGKHIPGNDVYVANITHKRKYRQYMNRRGGFNRPLDFIM